MEGKLDERKMKILHAIIRNYLETGEPVGSRTISKYTDLNLSSATIRNEMADLEEMGLEALYTDALLKAVGDADPDAIVIVDDTALLGDPDGAYIVLGKDQTDVIGITEFHYPE